MKSPQQLWRDLQKQVNKITDRLGMPIDKGIKEMVVALQAYGFQTCMSCEGHVDRGCCYPWVMFDPPQPKGKQKPNPVSSDAQRLEKLLYAFVMRGRSKAEMDARLHIFPRGNGGFRLQAAGSQTLDYMPKEILTRSKKAQILKRYRREMNAFQRFLKEGFFYKKQKKK